MPEYALIDLGMVARVVQAQRWKTVHTLFAGQFRVERGLLSVDRRLELHAHDWPLLPTAMARHRLDADLPFRFTGRLEKLTIELKGAKTVPAGSEK